MEKKVNQDCDLIEVQFISQYFWPEEMATSEMLSNIAFKLSESGLSLTALAGQPAYWENKESLPKVLEHRGVIVKRVRSTQLDKNKTFGRIFNTLTFTISVFIAVVFGKQPGINLVVTNPPTLLWISRISFALRGTPFVLIIHDVYPDVAISLNRLDSNSIVSKLWRILNSWTYKKASKIIVMGECMNNVLQSQIPQSEHNKIVTVPNWSNGEKIKPYPRKNHPLLTKWGMADKFVVQYSGNIGIFHDIDTIIETAELLKNENEIHFLFIGEGGQLSKLKDKVEAMNLRNVSFMPIQPKSDLPLTLTACDLGLVTLKNEVTGFCVPSKLYGILAAGKPVLGVINPDSETAKTIIDNVCGENVSPGDSALLAATIMGLYRDPDKCRRLSESSRNTYDKFYTLNKISAKYLDVINEVGLENNVS